MYTCISSEHTVNTRHNELEVSVRELHCSFVFNAFSIRSKLFNLLREYSSFFRLASSFALKNVFESLISWFLFFCGKFQDQGSCEIESDLRTKSVNKKFTPLSDNMYQLSHTHTHIVYKEMTFVDFDTTQTLIQRERDRGERGWERGGEKTKERERERKLNGRQLFPQVYIENHSVCVGSYHTHTY